MPVVAYCCDQSGASDILEIQNGLIFQRCMRKNWDHLQSQSQGIVFPKSSGMIVDMATIVYAGRLRLRK